MAQEQASTLAKLARLRVLIPAFLLLLLLAGGLGYLILLRPRSIFMRWAQSDLPDQITMISIGPYPEDEEFQHLKKAKVKYIVSLLDPRLPYEKELIEREMALAPKYQMTVKVFPMASIFDRQIFPDYLEQQQKAVDFLKNLDGPAYMHCYLGKHRVIHVRDELVKAGVPKRYWTAASSSQEYWDLVNRLDEARELFRQKDYSKVVEVLAPVTVKDVDVTSLRGWSHYRVGMIEEAAEDFRQGLEAEPTNPRNLLGSGYCYLRSGQAVMAQRQFSAVLEQIPDEPGALTGMGLAHLRLGNKAAAAQLFRRVLEKEPGSEEARNYLRQAEAP
ncbi:MAG: tetratricopeptide repeat protein [Acidobacteriia bacterium]|nr:tetratricopeptide repeat protein [Terriglobia bacterium]